MSNTHTLGDHPRRATRADTGELLHTRRRKGSTNEPLTRCAPDILAHVRRAGATGQTVQVARADAGNRCVETWRCQGRSGFLRDWGPAPARG